METKRWIREAERAGWRVAGVSARVVRLRCSMHGCTGSLELPLANLGPIPETCDFPHDHGHARSTFDDYRALVEELRRRRRSLGLDQVDLNDAMGTADGYVSKLESFARVASAPTLALWCQALGVSMTLAPAPLPPATAKAIEDRQVRPYAPEQARFKHSRQQLPLKLT